MNRAGKCSEFCNQLWQLEGLVKIIVTMFVHPYASTNSLRTVRKRTGWRKPASRSLCAR
jgi:hypothetical protein